MTGGDVLVLRALGLGDALTGVAALRGVRRAWPGRRLVLAAPTAVGGWLRDLGVVDDVLPTTGLDPLAWQGRDHVAVNLHGRGPQSHRRLLDTSPSELVAFASPETGHVTGPSWRPDEHEVERWCRLVTWAGGPCGVQDLRLAPPAPDRGQDVVLHPGAASGSRRWPVERWSELAAGLAAAGHPVVVTGGPGERVLCAAVVDGAERRGARPARAPADGAARVDVGTSGRVTDVAGRHDLAGLAAVVARARLVVCGDTGVAHVATAYSTPSVLLFGPTPPQWWGPAVDVDLHRVLWHGEPGREGDPHGDDVDPALASIGTAEVRAAVDALLERAAPGPDGPDASSVRSVPGGLRPAG